SGSLPPLRLVTADFRPERDREPVPAIDDDDRHGEPDELRLVEVCADGVVDLVRNALAAELGDRFRPGERGPLAGSEERRLAPYGNGVEALLRLACRASALGV